LPYRFRLSLKFTVRTMYASMASPPSSAGA
jgi:hypothetical protein